MPVIYTIGHSNRTMEEFLEILLKYGIEVVADVRRFPTSKFVHFKQSELKRYLKESGIEYIWFEGLGGYRKKILKRSPNIAIKSEGFRNYADYMLTEDFRREVLRLADVAIRKRTAIMCSERFFWRCHRRFLSDYLILLGFDVIHIINDRTVKHRMSRNARVVGGNRIIYDIL